MACRGKHRFGQKNVTTGILGRFYELFRNDRKRFCADWWFCGDLRALFFCCWRLGMIEDFYDKDFWDKIEEIHRAHEKAMREILGEQWDLLKQKKETEK